MLGVGRAKVKRQQYEVGDPASFTIYFGYGYTSGEGVIVECVGEGEYIVSCKNGARFVVRVGKDGELISGGAN